ncbi:hypothetical protein [Amycolatopsis sp. EV170708-02-1]|uniref:hypothetical protein n=1 Tax=Amycolatopsis sp. EV170708-02-1 TaxID=2919322 RepID=UPI001F0BDD69|nr:hypothetical protein [Amycolatopsis sp. EV170708-02-1]UMP00046.1 hypothetical protein MJQ72_26450 [Amycolatopsis sp. EV170708-02-1]
MFVPTLGDLRLPPASHLVPGSPRLGRLRVSRRTPQYRGPRSPTQRSVILAGDRSFDGPVTLAAPSAVTFGDLAEIASDLTGRTIERVVVDDDQRVADQLATGVPEQMARLLLTWYQAARAGHFAETGPVLAELLGREPRSVTDRLATHIAT